MKILFGMRLRKNNLFLAELYKKKGFDFSAEWFLYTLLWLFIAPFVSKNKLRKYIRNIEYDRIETYSGIRGAKYDAFTKKREKKISELKDKLSTARYNERQQYIDELEKEKVTRPIRNIRLDGEVHESATKIGEVDNKDAKKIFSILKKGRSNFLQSLCIGIYRDSIVFYSNNNISGILHICFECNLMRNEKEEYFSVDDYTYFKIKQFLISRGHLIKT